MRNQLNTCAIRARGVALVRNQLTLYGCCLRQLVDKTLLKTYDTLGRTGPAMLLMPVCIPRIARQSAAIL